MENKRTEELRKYKASVKSKLMAAIAMLMVSSILLSSTTYAWFILSTAPEVKGMATTVGSNGSLEIALLDDAADYGTALAAVTSRVGDSVAATQDMIESNTTWGNIVDLGSDDTNPYGLRDITLYPSALNLQKNDDETGYVGTLADAGQLLKIPFYGVDGRVAELKADTYAGKLEGGVFVYDQTYFGVRGIGYYTEANETAAALLAAQSGYRNALTTAKNIASQTVLSATNSEALTRLLVKYALVQAGKADQLQSLEILDKDITALKSIIPALKSIASNLENAIKYAIIAKDVSDTNAPSAKTLENVTLSADDATFGTEITALNALNDSIDAAELKVNAATTTAYNEALNALMDLANMKIGGKTIDEVKALADVTSWATGLLNDAVIEVNSANCTFGMTANMISTFASYSEFDVDLDNAEGGTDMSDATFQVNKTVATATMDTLNTTVNGYTVDVAEGESGKPTVQTDDAYAYIIDLAFRCSTNTTLQLSAAQNRVAGQGATAGEGSVFTVTTDGEVDENAMEELANALRVVFIDPTNNTIINVAGLKAAPVDGNEKQYELLMMEYRITDDGGIVLDAPQGQTYNAESRALEGTYDPSIVALTADTAKGISVLVYLDGNYTDSSMEGVVGMLNLQFSSSTSLEPMSYNDWVDVAQTETISVKVKAEGLSGDQVATATLLVNGQDSGKSVTLNQGNTWEITQSLPKTVQGQTVTYTVQAGAVDGYTAVVSGNQTDGFTITYTAN